MLDGLQVAFRAGVGLLIIIVILILYHEWTWKKVIEKIQTDIKNSQTNKEMYDIFLPEFERVSPDKSVETIKTDITRY